MAAAPVPVANTGFYDTPFYRSDPWAPDALYELDPDADAPVPIEVARVLNCAGPGADYDRIPDKLIRGLLRDGVARPDPLRLGLDVTGNCALLNKDGAISRRLFAVGP